MIGNQIAHFRLLAKVGEGGMGIVYRAEDLDLGRIVALKVLPPHLVGDQDRRSRFVAEARTAASVTHPNIGTIHEIGEDDGIIYIAMEFVDGESLRRRLRAGMSVKEAVRVASEIAEGLAAAHRARIAHRDLKPDNIVVSREGHVKILDFGLARLLDLPNATPEPFAPPDTITHTSDEVAPYTEAPDLAKAVTIPVGDHRVLGTPAYMSPEQARGLDIDYRTDLFSFGCTFYEMLTGRPPFQGPSTTSVIHEIVNRDPVPATVLNPDVPSSVQWVLDKCLEKDPNRRYQDTRDLVVDMAHLVPESGALTGSGETDPWRRSGPQVPAPRHRRWRVAVAATLLAVLLGATAWFLRNGGIGPASATSNSLAVFSFENLRDPSDPDRLGKIMQELLITDLSGLEPLKVYSSQRLADIERQIPRQDGAANVQSAVARRAGAQRMLTGTLSPRGEDWVLTAQLTDVATGQVLGSKRLDGTDIYAMVDQLTHELQADFTLHLPDDVAGRSIREKTSTSTQAWKHYLGGVDHLNANQFSEAVEQLTEAVRIDPKFGQAHYQLGLATWWLYSDIGAGREHLQHFLEDELYASPQEKSIAEAMLLVIDARFAEALPVLEALAREHPDDKFIWYGLGEAQFHFMGGSKMSASLPSFQRAAALDPDFLLPYWHIFSVLWDEERIDEAVSLADERISHDPGNPLWHRYRAASVVYAGDTVRGLEAVTLAESQSASAEDRRDLHKLVATAWGALGYVSLAEECLEKALDADPGHDDPQVLKGLTEYLRMQKKLDEYEERVRGLLAENPDNDLYQASLIDVQFERHRYADALRMAKERAAAEPSGIRWYWYWAAAAILSGDEASLPELEARVQAENQSPDDQRHFLAAVADAYSACGYQNKAIEYFRRAIAVDAEPEANLLQAVGYREMRRGLHAQAESWFRRAAEIAPKNPKPVLLMALLDVERGDLARAKTRLAEAQTLQPASKLVPFLGASLGVFTGEDAALAALLSSEVASLTAEFQKWRFLYAEPGDFPLGVGWAYLLAGRVEEAEQTFVAGTTSEFAQRDPVAHEGLGFTYLHTGKYVEAESAFQAGLAVGPEKGSALRGIGIAKLLQGDAVAAEAHARRALSEDHPHIDSWRLLGFALGEQQRYREALAVAEKAVAMDSSRASYELLAWTLVSGDLDMQRGIEVAKQSLDLPLGFLDVEKSLPHRVCAQHSLGHAYLKQGKTQLAVEYLEKAAELQPRRACIREDLLRATSAARGT